jgi:hypothetical protein
MEGGTLKQLPDAINISKKQSAPYFYQVIK